MTELTTPAQSTANAHAHSFSAIDGSPIDLADYQGKTLLVVNTASQCGFTPQYADLQAIHEQYKDRGLVVLGVPSNDFGGQEPGTEEEIKAFTEKKFDVTFPMTAKQTVSGDNAHPFYRWASEEAGFMGRPRWNFHKYLIDGDGNFVDWFASTTSPRSDKVRAAIEKSLNQEE